MNEGGDKRTPRAKADIAKREQQIVALRLRGIRRPRSRGWSASAIVRKEAFRKALHRNTDEISRPTIASNSPNSKWKRPTSGGRWTRTAITGRYKWLAPRNSAASISAGRICWVLTRQAKFDVRAVYGGGGEEASEERRTKELAWLAMPPEERARIYDSLYEARKRLNAPIETTATVTLGSDNRNDEVESSDDE